MFCIPFESDDVFAQNDKLIFCGERNGHSVEWFENKIIRIVNCPEEEYIGLYYHVAEVHPYYDNFGNIGSAISLAVYKTPLPTPGTRVSGTMVSDDKIMVYKVAPDDVDNCPMIFTDFAAMHKFIAETLSYSEVGDVLAIGIDEMTQAEFDALPEHPGW